ncbi:putative disease resistance RPP13-like protein 1 isoform X1 [Ananas comosus]|uniref:Disease resistance RPP13-like protein 1 isoform X1 n=1 Tax=Ananas comosus TaxID=4615 RepID=A0A6P5GLG2_ANACO|nr:putative disease resistance RPP13-like protein 1 isoform X1 [Ananas comosus]
MASSLFSLLVSAVTKLTRFVEGANFTSLLPSSSSNPFATLQEDLKHLKRTLLRIHATLADVEEREIRDSSVKLWLHEIKAVAYDADDILDEYHYELLRRQVEGKPSPVIRKRKMGEIHDLSFPAGLSGRINEVRMRLDEIAKDRDALHLREEDGERRLNDACWKLIPTSSLVDDSRVYGRDIDKKNIIQLLLSDGQPKVDVIPIVGPGGVGKTTLAQLVYNDPMVRCHFHLYAWICTSQSFDVLKITQTIVKSVTKSSCDSAELDDLHHSLKKALKNKKFLLVLDDVWNEQQSLWELLCIPFSKSMSSKIIVTTRNESTARIMHAVTPYRLGLLTEKDCWLVFKRYAFEHQPQFMSISSGELTDMGYEIARRCEGLPLAAKTLGSLLRLETDEEMWREVLQSEFWVVLNEERNEILPALMLSYHRMPSHLRQCFTYTSAFPKGYLFEKPYIVKLWMAQGYIVHNGRNSSPEEVGGTYFDELLQRSMFQHSQSLDTTKDGWFCMHELIHDLAKSISGRECITAHDSRSLDVDEDTLHASLVPTDGQNIIEFQTLNEPKRLRTFLILKLKQMQVLQVEMPEFLLQNLKCLRTIDLSYTMLEVLPDSIGELKHLRYLGLRETNIRVLPESLCSLYNLQVLDLSHCMSILELPQGIGNLVSLRHLSLPVMEDSHICMPTGLGNLTNLRSLSAFYIGGNKWHCGIGELTGLVDLRELRILGLERVTESDNADLTKMKNLEKLTIFWSYGSCTASDDCSRIRVQYNCTNWRRTTIDIQKLDAAYVLENLQLHTTLKELALNGYNGTRLPSWLGDPSFSKLTSIRLDLGDDKCTFLPPLGRLPSLKHLFVGGMQRMQCIGREFCGCCSASAGGFRALETLELTEMRALEEWREVHINDFPRLDELAISTCPKLYRLPDCLSSLAKLEINDCKVLTTFPKLPSLTGLKLWGSCNWHIWSVSLDLPNLEYLQISNYDRPTLDFYPNLPALKVLTIECCKNLEKAAGSHHLISLQSLEIYSCPKFQGLTDKHLHPQFAVFLGLGESKPPLPYSKARDRPLARLMQKEDFNSHQERISQFNLFPPHLFK